MEPYKLDIAFESALITTAPRKLTAKWTLEGYTKYLDLYGSLHIWKEHRCYKNALKAEARGDFRRSNYWLRQGARYHRMKRD